MASMEEDSLFLLSDDDDDLLEIQDDDSHTHFYHLPRPRRDSGRSSRAAQRAHELHIREHIPRLSSFRNQQQQQQPSAPAPQQEASVIDLTEEPDSPILVQRATSQTQGSRNPRRTNSQGISPPRLARSDSTFMAQGSSYIDLTADSPEEDRPADRLRSQPAHHHHHHHHHHHRPPSHTHHFLHQHQPLLPHLPNLPPQRPRPDELIDIEFIQSVPRGRVPGFAIGIGRRLAGIFGADIINFNSPDLDISRNAFAPRESPKPPMEPVPPTRDGFTRDTCAEPEKESENVVICPACSEELAYDPTGTVVQSSTGSGKKRKRAPGEHHFWALKKCGHVYCADCFENRRPTKTHQSGFRVSGHSTNANDLRCAVDDCETKVALKGEWVGIYL